MYQATALFNCSQRYGVIRSMRARFIGLARRDVRPALVALVRSSLIDLQRALACLRHTGFSLGLDKSLDQGRPLKRPQRIFRRAGTSRKTAGLNALRASRINAALILPLVRRVCKSQWSWIIVWLQSARTCRPSHNQ